MGRWKGESVSLRVSRQQSEQWVAAADKDGLTLRAWCIRHLDAASEDRSTQLMLEAQRKYRIAGHPKVCGCGDCLRG